MANQIATFTTKEASSSKELATIATTSYTSEGVDQEQCQYVNNQNFNYCPNNVPTHYHRGLRNHENFSYVNPRNALQAPSGFQQLVIVNKPSIEDLLNTFNVETRRRFNKDEARHDNIKTHCTNMNASIKSLEMQVGQLANEIKNQSKGKFSIDTKQNPRDQCKAIITRSGKEVGSSKLKEVMGEEVEVEV